MQMNNEAMAFIVVPSPVPTEYWDSWECVERNSQDSVKMERSLVWYVCLSTIGIQLLFERIETDIFMMFICEPASAGYCRLPNTTISRIADI